MPNNVEAHINVREKHFKPEEQWAQSPSGENKLGVVQNQGRANTDGFQWTTKRVAWDEAGEASGQ